MMSMFPTIDHPVTRSLAAAAIFAAMGLFAIPSAHAATKNSKAVPVQIHSDNAELSQDNNKSTYTGNVKLTRAGLTLTGDKLVVTRLKNRSHIKAVLTGNPAHIDKQPDADGDKVITGHSNEIVYTNGNSLITLIGDAVVNRGGDHITASTITYNINSGITKAKSGQGDANRVHITIQPKSGQKN